MRLRPVTAGCAQCIQWQIYSGQVDGQARCGTACALQYTRSPRRVNGCGATRRGLAVYSIHPSTVVVSPRPDPDARQHIAATRHDSPRVVAPAVSPREHGRRTEEPCEQRALGVVATSRRSQQPRLASHASHPKRSDVTRTLQTKFTRTARLTLTARAELEASADPPRRVSMMYCLVAVATARRRRRQTLGLSERPLPSHQKVLAKLNEKSRRRRRNSVTDRDREQRAGARTTATSSLVAQSRKKPSSRGSTPGTTLHVHAGKFTSVVFQAEISPSHVGRASGGEPNRHRVP